MKHIQPYSTFIREKFIPYDFDNALDDEDAPPTPFPNSVLTGVLRRGSPDQEVPTDYPMFFTDDVYCAESYGNYVREAHLNITNMLDMHSPGEGRYGEGLARRIMPFVYSPTEIEFIEKNNLLDIRLNLDLMSYRLYEEDFEDIYDQERKQGTKRVALELRIAQEYFQSIGADDPKEWAFSFFHGQFFMVKNAIGHPLTTVLNLTQKENNVAKMFAYAKQHGYDGIMMKDESSDCQSKCRSYVVFDPKQIAWIREYKHTNY